MRNALVAGAVVLAMCATPAYARTARKGAHTAKGSSDTTFVKTAANVGIAEVELGNLAASKASSDQVKQFAQRMVTDHGKANDELKSVTQTKNITLPTDLDPKDKALKDRLSKLSGPSFDRAYMNAMLMDHRKDVNEFRRESKMGKRPPLMKWSSVVARDSPNRFFTGPFLYSSVYFLSDQSSKKPVTWPSSGLFGSSEAASTQIR